MVEGIIISSAPEVNGVSKKQQDKEMEKVYTIISNLLSSLDKYLRWNMLASLKIDNKYIFFQGTY